MFVACHTSGPTVLEHADGRVLPSKNEEGSFAGTKVGCRELQPPVQDGKHTVTCRLGGSGQERLYQRHDGASFYDLSVFVSQVQGI